MNIEIKIVNVHNLFVYYYSLYYIYDRMDILDRLKNDMGSKWVSLDVILWAKSQEIPNKEIDMELPETKTVQEIFDEIVEYLPTMTSDDVIELAHMILMQYKMQISSPEEEII